MYKAKRFKFEISFDFKQLLIFIKCFQHTVELKYACNEKALFTGEKRIGRALQSVKKTEREREKGQFPSPLSVGTRLSCAEQRNKTWAQKHDSIRWK